MLISAVFLADAIRRLSIHFKKDPRLQVNHKVMRLHITALFIHTFFLILFQVCVVALFKKTDKKWWVYKDTSRNLMYTS